MSYMVRSRLDSSGWEEYKRLVVAQDEMRYRGDADRLGEVEAALDRIESVWYG